ncbi:YceI family protein [Pontibacter liquoris]|uniref:YceI family protein n=1 Tax=Pontibacter liquoris TaxID=2905677 RepID=UPI001FA6ACCA|nr:YceI family protein [Pontibacter liquoris]
MKKITILASLAATLFFTANAGTSKVSTPASATTEVAAPAKGKAYSVVADKSELKWHGKKVTGEHFGNFKLKSGALNIANNKLAGGEFVIDMTSISNTDIQDAEYKGKLEGHLKSDDFFGVEKFPTATFKVTNVKPIANAAAGKPNYTVTGDLTIKGTTNPVSFPATVTVNKGVANAKADITVNRAKYDVRYGSESFFGSLGDKAIYDDFVVSINLTAKQ